MAGKTFVPHPSKRKENEILHVNKHQIQRLCPKEYELFDLCVELLYCGVKSVHNTAMFHSRQQDHRCGSIAAGSARLCGCRPLFSQTVYKCATAGSDKAGSGCGNGGVALAKPRHGQLDCRPSAAESSRYVGRWEPQAEVLVPHKVSIECRKHPWRVGLGGRG